MKRLFALLLLGLAWSCAPGAQERVELPLGPWSGALKVNDSSLSLTVRLQRSPEGELKISLDSPDQGVTDIPGELIFHTTDSLAVVFSPIEARFNGYFQHADHVVGEPCGSNCRLKGIFMQGFFITELLLAPGEVAYYRPQEPQPPFPYEQEDVYLDLPDGARLAGTFTYPQGYVAGEPMLVMLMVSGSGPQDRNGELMGHKPFLIWADELARAGFASLRYDDRGVGGSTGASDEVTTHDLAQDAAIWADYIRTHYPCAKLGLLGHSEGGSIAFIMAAKKKVDFAIALAGPAEQGAKILAWQLSRRLDLMGYTEQEIATCRTTCEQLLTPRADGSYRSAAELAAEAGLDERLTSMLKTVEEANNPWLKAFCLYDPKADIAQVNIPFLALYGERDKQVNPETNGAALKEAMPADSPIVMAVLPELNHLFQTAPTGEPDEYAQIDETLSPEVIRWVLSFIHSI